MIFQHVGIAVSPPRCSSSCRQMEAAILVSCKKDILSLFPERTSSFKEKVGYLVAPHVVIMHGLL